MQTEGFMYHRHKKVISETFFPANLLA